MWSTKVAWIQIRLHFQLNSLKLSKCVNLKPSKRIMDYCLDPAEMGPCENCTSSPPTCPFLWAVVPSIFVGGCSKHGWPRNLDGPKQVVCRPIKPTSHSPFRNNRTPAFHPSWKKERWQRMTKEKQVTVLGAGYSGLTTAAELTLRGFKVSIYIWHNSLLNATQLPETSLLLFMWLRLFIAGSCGCCRFGLSSSPHHSWHPIEKVKAKLFFISPILWKS